MSRSETEHAEGSPASLPRRLGDAYEQLRPELERFATVLAGRNNAEDIVASVFAKAMMTPTWSAADNPRAYLYRMVRNEVQDSKRRSASRARREARALLASDFESVVNPESSVDVRRAIAQLSSRQRAVVFLYFWNDSSESEIAELLGIRPGSVRRHLSRARSHLRRTLR